MAKRAELRFVQKEKAFASNTVLVCGQEPVILHDLGTGCSVSMNPITQHISHESHIKFEIIFKQINVCTAQYCIYNCCCLPHGGARKQWG